MGCIRAIFERRLPPVTANQLECETQVRLARGQIFDRLPGTAFGFVIEQAVLERRLGGIEVTRQVIDHLLHVGARRNVEIQVMPLRREAHCGVDGQLGHTVRVRDSKDVRRTPLAVDPAAWAAFLRLVRRLP